MITLRALYTKHTFQQFSSMSDKIIPSLHTLPVEFVYKILDELDDFTILCSMQNVCKRLNEIVHTYHRYQVNFSFIPMSNFLLSSKHY